LPRHSFRRGPWEPAAPNSLPPSRWPRAPAPVKGRVWSLAGSRPIPAGSPGRGGRPGPPRLRRESACPGASLRRQRPGRCRESPGTGEPGQTCLSAAAPSEPGNAANVPGSALNEPDPVTGLGGGVADQDVPAANCGGGRRAGQRDRKDHGHSGPRGRSRRCRLSAGFPSWPVLLLVAGGPAARGGSGGRAGGWRGSRAAGRGGVPGVQAPPAAARGVPGPGGGACAPAPGRSGNPGSANPEDPSCTRDCQERHPGRGGASGAVEGACWPGRTGVLGRRWLNCCGRWPGCRYSAL
jgi:hypothetical protein